MSFQIVIQYFFSRPYNGGDETKDQVSVVPADMSPPSSPTRLDGELVMVRLGAALYCYWNKID